ncbi:MAG: ATP-dependent DNA helicase [Nitrososphaerales archaeon]|nr:ATP-dependent DNA helicase [Nitrososphaerales archaeon]
MDVDAFFAYDSFRPGQRELALWVYKRCLDGGVTLAEAMSGFGKTAAVLCGTVAAAEETGCRVVYACRTKRQIHRVVEELSRLQKKRPLRAASLSSKFDYCLLKKRASRSVPQEAFGWYCGFNVSNNLCSYFLNVALLGAELDRAVESVANSIPPHPELLRRSESIHVCPYELVRLAAAEAEVVVVPYQYVLDPRSKPVLFDKNAIEPSDSILVVDEAHNIRDFMRGIHSAKITLAEMEAAINEAEALLMDEAASSLRILKQEVEATMGRAAGWYIDRGSLLRRIAEERGGVWLQNLTFALNSCSTAAWRSITYEARLPSAVLKVGDFLLTLTSSESGVLAKWDSTLGLIEPNPVKLLPDFLGGFRSSVLVSATVNPSSVFLRSLGLDSSSPEVYETQAESFVTVLTLIDTGVTTRYRLRGPQMFSKIAAKITSVIEVVENGACVFVPSYALLDPIAELASKRLPERHTVKEFRGMSNQDAADAVDSLASQKGSVLFAVQGGRFSEGEDFRGDLIDAVFVVGLSLPPPSPMLYAEYACLREAGEPDSFLMLSRLPALRKAFQAAGRHIRDPGKRGLVVLLDDRFDAKVVRELMPSWLRSDVRSGDFAPQEVQAIVRDFWRSGRRT